MALRPRVVFRVTAWSTRWRKPVRRLCSIPLPDRRTAGIPSVVWSETVQATCMAPVTIRTSVVTPATEEYLSWVPPANYPFSTTSPERRTGRQPTPHYSETQLATSTAPPIPATPVWEWCSSSLLEQQEPCPFDQTKR